MSKIRAGVAKVVAELIPYRPWRQAVYHFLRDGSLRQIRQNHRDGRRLADELRGGVDAAFKTNLAVVAIMKDEGLFLREWIEYHRLVGVEKFYLYDNDSSDNTRAILAPYIESGVVEYVWFPGDKMQRAAYNDCIARHRMDTRWLAVIDLDEFIVPVECDTVPQFLNRFDTKTGQVLFRWVMYGSNGHEARPDGLVIENYTRRWNKYTRHVKAIVRPYLVQAMGCHEHAIIGGRTHRIRLRRMRINHYHCKSWQDYSMRAARGDAWNGAAKGMRRYTREFFDSRDHNEVFDPIMERYYDRMHEILRK